VESQAEKTREAAAQRTALGQFDEAMRLAEEAASVHRNQESQRLLAVLRLLRRDFAGAFQDYRQIKQTQT
jgi:hypothetical protein